jgi:hypothetical protein
MGSLIHTKGTAYLCAFYNNEFEQYFAFHKGNRGLYNRGGAHWNVWDHLIDSIRDPGRGNIKPLFPTPGASQPNLVARWRLFFKGPIYSQANQDKLIDAVFGVLSNGASTGILFGVRPALPGLGPDVDCFPIPGAPTDYIINIVVDAASVIPPGGPPPIDPQW